jgi:putative tricarboxylic transport membrane protein
VLAVAAPQRVGGNMANVPTMREQGVPATGISNWRGIFGPKGITPAQVAYWEEALGKAVATEEWKKQLDDNNLVSRFLRSKEFAKYLQEEYSDTRSVMSDIGLIKQ